MLVRRTVREENKERQIASYIATVERLYSASSPQLFDIGSSFCHCFSACAVLLAIEALQLLENQLPLFQKALT